MMANLPEPRVNASRPFEHTGVDYAGPILLLNRRGRGSRTLKSYIVLFICFSSKAIHLELASDLTTDTFIASLKRFVSRRGIPSRLYSDNGTNFVGACRILTETQNALLSLYKDELTSHFLATNNITWVFNPPSAPHFGGLWEAGVKAVKTTMKRIIGITHLTYEEMLTVLVQIEGLLNSRPLVPVNDDISCLDALTPAHFLIGQPLTTVPELHISQPINSIRERWRVVQKIKQDFWKRWHMEYLTTLQQRPKWQKVEETLNRGDMVLIKDSNLQPSQWLIGRIKETHQGQDKLVRVATVTTKTGDIKRPITKLCKITL